MPRQYSHQFRERAVALFQDGRDVRDLATYAPTRHRALPRDPVPPVTNTVEPSNTVHTSPSTKLPLSLVSGWSAYKPLPPEQLTLS